MKPSLFLLELCTCLLSCKDKYQVSLDRLDGDWQIKSITSTQTDGQVVRQENSGLGSFHFSTCDYREKVSCEASRTLASGNKLGIQILPASSKAQERVHLSFIGPRQEEDDWSGTYDIERAGKQMILKCDQCRPSAGGTFTIVTEKQ